MCVCVCGFRSSLVLAKPSECLYLSTQAYVFSKVNAASAAFMSQAKGRPQPSSAHEPPVESSVANRHADPTMAAVGVKPEMPPWTGHAPQISPRSPSKRGLEEGLSNCIGQGPLDLIPGPGRGGGRRAVKAIEEVIESEEAAHGSSRPSSAGIRKKGGSTRLQSRQQQQVTITAMPGFVQRRSQRHAEKKQAEGDQ